MGWRWPVRRTDSLTTFIYRLSWNLGASSSWNPQGLSRPVMGLLFTWSAWLWGTGMSHKLVQIEAKLGVSKVGWYTKCFSHKNHSAPWHFCPEINSCVKLFDCIHWVCKWMVNVYTDKNSKIQENSTNYWTVPANMEEEGQEKYNGQKYRGADKSLAPPGGKWATVTEDFDVHISYLLS